VFFWVFFKKKKLYLSCFAGKSLFFQTKFLFFQVCFWGSKYFLSDSSQKTNGTPLPSFSRLAVKTASLESFAEVYFLFIFFILFCRKKFVLWGRFFSRFASKNKWDTLPFFFDILASFGVKNVSAFFL